MNRLYTKQDLNNILKKNGFDNFDVSIEKYNIVMIDLLKLDIIKILKIKKILFNSNPATIQYKICFSMSDFELTIKDCFKLLLFKLFSK